MRYIEAPEEWDRRQGEYGLFLAGGITGCPDWQSEIVDILRESLTLVLLNPRRKDFPIYDPNAAESQIKWEHRHLRKADGISFWFPKESLCPIVLYELGAWSMTNKPIFVGIHPEYQRRKDVEIQTALTRESVRIVYSLDDLARVIWRGARTKD